MDRSTARPSGDILRRIQGEFLEMPGLRLTELQARRLWDLDAPCCSSVLQALVQTGFLFRTRDGAFMRTERAKPLKIELPLPTASGVKLPAS